MTEYLESFINIVYDIKSSWSGENITSLDLIGRVLSNSTLLKAVANRTSLSVEYINNTIISVVGNAKEIAELYQVLSNGNNDDRLQVEPLNTTNATICEPSINPNDMIPISLIPAIIIMIILSMVNTRVWKRNYCGGRPGLLIPVNLLDSFEDRFSYAFAFGATASRIIQVILGSGYTSIFGDDFQSVTDSNSIPSWFSAVFKIVASFFVGVSYYPFFACITTHQRLLGAVLGTIYSSMWFSAYISQMVQCGGKSEYGVSLQDNLALTAPPIICHGLLLLCFIRVLVRSLISKKRGMVISEDEWKENYKYHHVKKLLKSAPKSSQTVIIKDGFKQKIISELYKWIPDFKYSTRIICIFLTAIISLYLIIVFYIIFSRIIYLLLNDLLDVFSANSIYDINWSRVKEGVKITLVCWRVAVALACIKSIIMMTNMISWYRGHVLRLQRGDRSFLPVTIDNQAPSDIMVASFKFAGYQVAYILWGFLIAQFIIFVIITILALSLIWPLIWGTVDDSLTLTVILKIWPTFFISLLTILVQRLMAKYIFLRDFGATLALNNRRLFHIASYFFFFLNIFVGLFSCLLRILFAMLFGVLYLPRLQKSALPRDWELFDPGYKTYVGYLCLEHTHANPVLLTFSKLLLDAVTVKGCCEDGIRMEGLNKMLARKARNRWFVAITLINNPELRDLRRQEHLTDKNLSTAIMKLAIDTYKITGAVTQNDC